MRSVAYCKTITTAETTAHNHYMSRKSAERFPLHCWVSLPAVKNGEDFQKLHTTKSNTYKMRYNSLSKKKLVRNQSYSTQQRHLIFGCCVTRGVTTKLKNLKIWSGVFKLRTPLVCSKSVTRGGFLNCSSQIGIFLEDFLLFCFLKHVWNAVFVKENVFLEVGNHKIFRLRRAMNNTVTINLLSLSILKRKSLAECENTSFVRAMSGL